MSRPTKLDLDFLRLIIFYRWEGGPSPNLPSGFKIETLVLMCLLPGGSEFRFTPHWPHSIPGEVPELILHGATQAPPTTLVPPP